MNELRVTQSDLAWAAGEGHITHKQSLALWGALVARAGGVTAPSAPKAKLASFEMSHLLYYGGAGIMLFALTVGLLQFFDNIGGAGIATITGMYGVGFACAAAYLWNRPELKTVGGIFAALAVSMVPLTVLGIEHAAGMFDRWDSVARFWQHVPMEVATIAASLIALRYIRFGLLTAPLTLASYLLMMDIAAVTIDPNSFVASHLTMIFGAVLMVGGFITDMRTKASEYDFGFWGFLFGGTAFWLGLNWLTWWTSGAENLQLVYLGVNAALLVVSVLVSRRLLTAYGTIGVAVYLFHLTWETFQHSQAFPFALAAVGLLMIVAGIAYTKNRARIEGAILSVVPSSLRQYLPTQRG